jgi:hypothetical protein
MAELKAQASADSEALEHSSAVAPGEIIIGTVAGINSEGKPLVDFGQNPTGSPVAALSTVHVSRSEVSRQVALLFADGDYRRPVIMGLIHSPLYAILENSAATFESSEDAMPAGEAPAASGDTSGVARIDGDRVVLEGKNEIVLKCGDASITLTRSGKVIIRGKYLLSRSSGVNRIMGGSVQVN